MSEYTESKKNYRIEACADSLRDVLKEYKNGRKYLSVKKHLLLEQTANRVVADWRKDKYFHTVDGKREIDCPNIDFIRANWKSIREYCTQQLNTKVTWSFDGIKIGNVDDYLSNQKHLESLAKGTTKVHNSRADYINHHGGQSQYLQVKLLSLPEPSNQ